MAGLEFQMQNPGLWLLHPQDLVRRCSLRRDICVNHRHRSTHPGQPGPVLRIVLRQMLENGVQSLLQGIMCLCELLGGVNMSAWMRFSRSWDSRPGHPFAIPAAPALGRPPRFCLSGHIHRNSSGIPVNLAVWSLPPKHPSHSHGNGAMRGRPEMATPLTHSRSRCDVVST